ncbi:exonuclease domain-containing protein [Sphingobacterium sp. KU25419]|nr:exonuclease domain-containing protein [Sphingobacterium sp. KU25419]
MFTFARIGLRHDIRFNIYSDRFETATGHQNSACAVGIVTVESGIITNEFYSLIQPPRNEYMWQTTRVHGIKPRDTQHSPTFKELFPSIKSLLANKLMIAHNELFDRNVLRKRCFITDCPTKNSNCRDVGVYL